MFLLLLSVVKKPCVWNETMVLRSFMHMFYANSFADGGVVITNEDVRA